MTPGSHPARSAASQWTGLTGRTRHGRRVLGARSATRSRGWQIHCDTSRARAATSRPCSSDQRRPVRRRRGRWRAMAGMASDRARQSASETRRIHRCMGRLSPLFAPRRRQAHAPVRNNPWQLAAVAATIRNNGHQPQGRDVRQGPGTRSPTSRLPVIASPLHRLDVCLSAGGAIIVLPVPTITRDCRLTVACSAECGSWPAVSTSRRRRSEVGCSASGAARRPSDLGVGTGDIDPPSLYDQRFVPGHHRKGWKLERAGQATRSDVALDRALPTNPTAAATCPTPGTCTPANDAQVGRVHAPVPRHRRASTRRRRGRPGRPMPDRRPAITNWRSSEVVDEVQPARRPPCRRSSGPPLPSTGSWCRCNQTGRHFFPAGALRARHRVDRLVLRAQRRHRDGHHVQHRPPATGRGFPVPMCWRSSPSTGWNT